MKYKSIIAFGDSHTAGCELIEDNLIAQYLSGKIGLEEMDSMTKPYAYPQYVADQLSIPCYNYSLSGGSNERSLRLLPQVIAAHPDSLVLFGYTAQNRREFYFDDSGKFLGRDNDNYMQAGIQWYNNGATDVAKKHGITHPFNNYFVENIMRWDQGDHTSILNAMFYAQHACTNVVHIFFFRDLFDKNNPINRLIDSSKILNFSGSDNDGYGQYQQWADNKGFPKLPMGHYNRAAHELLGQLILDHLNSDSTK
jgi:hypothetical protein